MCSTPKDLSQCCALYSATGLVFMTWVGLMLMNQPFFVGGIEDVEKAKGNAFGAAALFFFIFLISIVHLIMDSMNGGGGPAPSTIASAATDSFGGWSGLQRQSGEYGQVPTFEGFEDDNDAGRSDQVGFLS